MTRPARGLAAALAAMAAAAVAIWSAGTSIPRIAGLGPPHADTRRAELMRELGTVSAAGAAGRPGLAQRARSMARAAPLDDAPFLVMGGLAEEEGGAGRAEALYRAALARNPRSRGAHFMLAARALAKRDADDALRHLAALARQSPGAAPEFARVMVAVASDPTLEPALRRFLAREPANRDTLFAAMAADPALADRLLVLASPGEQPPAWLPVLAKTYVMAGRPDRAAIAWTRFGGGADPREAIVRDPGFGPPSAGEPFGWSFDSAEAGAAAPGRGGLEVESYGRSAGRLAVQWLLLTPGRYSLATEGGGDVRALLEWRVQCLGPSPKALGAVPATRAGGFTVPAGCPAQAIELWTRSDDSAAPASGKLSRVRLERMP